jgi:glycosyltransferase involved in cell wall biosynthesis
MRLIHLADYGGTYPGSFIPMVRAVLEGGRSRGWDVQAVFSEVAHDRTWLGELRNAGFDCRLAPTGRRELDGLLQEMLIAGEPTILHTHFTAFDIAAARATRHRPQTIAYWHLHSALRPGIWWRARNAVKFGLLSRGVEEILCVAPNIRDQARERLAPADRLVVVPNAIELTRFPLVTPQRRLKSREALALPPDAKVVLHFGWDWDRKGGDIFLEAIASLVKDQANGDLVAVTVAGHDRAGDAAKSLGIGEKLRILEPTDDVAALYAAADVFAAPSRGEGHPFAVAEALASGLPVVASPIPGHEMIAAGTEGCRIAPLEAHSFSGALREVMAVPEVEADRISLAARDWVVAEMDIGAWSERMLARYETALERR